MAKVDIFSFYAKTDLFYTSGQVHVSLCVYSQYDMKNPA
jgi:hypothetical protein